MTSEGEILFIKTVSWGKIFDGKQESCLVTAEAYLAWLSEGNTPEAADAP